ncbi:MAG: tyrosine--tRNA ligase [Nitrospirae bacterium]|nr:tyrosine--tRNA ligase [Nitrospirota bacterium]
MRSSSKSRPDGGAHDAELDRQLAVIRRGVAEILPDEHELRERLRRSLAAGAPLVIKAGFDPTAPHLHLGHAVLLQKLHQFQELGHAVTFLIGDFTGMIGDPSGVSETRKPLTPEQVKENAKTYQQQIRHFLDPARTTVAFNSAWMRPMTAEQFIQLAAQYNVARMLEREDFKTRFEAHRPIGLHEFLYPLIQGYDSVQLKADIELGGTDQKFNLLVGRELQKQAGRPPQIVITMPLLEGTDGVRKMSKSFGNAIGVEEAPEEIFGKVMSIPDELMLRYYQLLTDDDLTTVKRLHPMEAKLRLAGELVLRFHGAGAAGKARAAFDAKFRGHAAATSTVSGELDVVRPVKSAVLLDALVEAKLATSKSDARRLIQQGAVDLDDHPMADAAFELPIGKTVRIKVGKRRFAELRRVV